MATIIIWSERAAAVEWVERAGMSTQRLGKPLFVVRLDETALSATWVEAKAIGGQPSCTEALALLRSLLPQPQADDVLQPVLRGLAHDYIRERKAAIREAATLLARGERREEVIPLLQEIAQHDLMMGVRELAQQALDAEAARRGLTSLEDKATRHIFGVRCANGHVSYYDRRRVCLDSTSVVRTTFRAGTNLSEVKVKCETKGCGQETVVPVDCEEYT